MEKDIVFDFKNKIISLSKRHKEKEYTVQEFYSFIQDTFDEPENMRYEIPIVAMSKNNFKLIDGWKIEKGVLNFLTNGTIKT